MDATTLARWTAFADSGGIGHAVSVRDHLAAEDGQLMFMTGEPIVVLAAIPPGHDLSGDAEKEEEEMYLGFCEGVVGMFRSSDVDFAGPISTIGQHPTSSSRAQSQSQPQFHLPHSISDQSIQCLSPSSSIDPYVHAHPNHLATSSPQPQISRTDKGRAIIPVDQLYTILSDRGERGYVTPEPSPSLSAGLGSGGFGARAGGSGKVISPLRIFREGSETTAGTSRDRGEKSTIDLRPGHLATSSIGESLISPTFGSASGSSTGSPISPTMPKTGTSNMLRPLGTPVLPASPLHTPSNPLPHSSPVSEPRPDASPAMSAHNYSFAARASQRASNPFELDSEYGSHGDGSGTWSGVGSGVGAGIGNGDDEEGEEMAVDRLRALPTSREGLEGGEGERNDAVLARTRGDTLSSMGRSGGTESPASFDVLDYKRATQDEGARCSEPPPHHSPGEDSEHLNEGPSHSVSRAQKKGLTPSEGSRASMMSLNTNSDGRSQGSEWGGLGWMMEPKQDGREKLDINGRQEVLHSTPSVANSDSSGSGEPSPPPQPSDGRQDTFSSPEDSSGVYADSDDGNFEIVEADAFPSPSQSELVQGSPMEIGAGSPPVPDAEAEVKRHLMSQSKKPEHVVRASPMANSWKAHTEVTGTAPSNRMRAMSVRDDMNGSREPVRGLFGLTASEESTGATLLGHGESPPGFTAAGHRDGSADSQHTLWTPELRGPPKVMGMVLPDSPISLANLPSPVMKSSPSMTRAASVPVEPRRAGGMASPPTRQLASLNATTQTSPGGTSVSVSAMARHHSGTTLVGATSVDLSTARNPVPITFILGDHNSPRTYSSPEMQEVDSMPRQQSPADPTRSRPIPAVAQGLLPNRSMPVSPQLQAPQEMLGPFPSKPSLGERRRSRSFSQFEAANRDTPQMANGTAWGPQTATGGLEDRYKGFMNGIKRDIMATDRSVSSPISSDLRPSTDAKQEQNRPRSKSLLRPGKHATPQIPQKKPSLPQLRVETANLSSLPPIPSLSPFLPGVVLRSGDQPSPSPSGRSLSSQASGSSDSLNRRKKGSAFAKDSPLGRPGLSKGPMSAVSNKDYTDVSLDGADFSFTVEAPDGNELAGTESAGFPDEWGFVGPASPVPGIFALSAMSARETPKIEQALLASIQKPYSASTGKKVAKQIMDKHLPPSLRSKCYGWLQSARPVQAPLRKDFIQIAEQLGGGSTRDIRQAQPVLWNKFHSHRAFASGMQDVQRILAVYAYRHPKQARSEVDLSWIAAMFLMNCFDVNEAYKLFESFVEEKYSAMNASGIAVDSIVIDEMLRSTDAQLAGHLASRGVRAEAFFRAWSHSLFAGALPYPTALRTLDLVVATGSIYLVRTALAVLSLMSKRIMSLGTGSEIVGYLLNLPADALLSPESVSKAAQKVSEDSIRKLRQKVVAQRGQ